MHSGSEIGFGKQLRAAREAAGLSLHDIADKLKLNTNMLQSLEAENIAELPAPAYVRGYLRSYAQLVKCDGEMIVGLYNSHAIDDPKLVYLDQVEPANQSNAKFYKWTTVLVIVVALLAGSIGLYDYFVYNKELFGNLPEAEPVMAEQVDNVYVPEQPVEFQQAAVLNYSDDRLAEVDHAAVDEPFNDESSLLDDEAADTVELLDEVEQVPSADIVAVSDDTSVAIVEQAEQKPIPNLENIPGVREIIETAPSGNDKLELIFDGESWIEVTDANGYRLIYGLFDTVDSSVSVSGQAPFDLIVGDVNVVALQVNDNAFDLKPYIKWNNAARILIRTKKPN